MLTVASDPGDLSQIYNVGYVVFCKSHNLYLLSDEVCGFKLSGRTMLLSKSTHKVDVRLQPADCKESFLLSTSLQHAIWCRRALRMLTAGIRMLLEEHPCNTMGTF